MGIFTGSFPSDDAASLAMKGLTAITKMKREVQTNCICTLTPFLHN